MTTPEHMQPQDAFAELTTITVADHSVERVMTKVATLAKRAIPGASEVSVTLVENGHASTVAHTGSLAIELDERQYEQGYGPCLDSIAGDGEPFIVNDMQTEQRWPDWAKAAAALGAGSSICIPIPLQRKVSAALNIYSTARDAFDEAAVEVGSNFAAYAGVVLANMHLYETQGQVAEQLQQAMQSRAVIEQAKGILMGQRRCNEQEAFDILTRFSQEANLELREMAEALIAESTDVR